MSIKSALVAALAMLLGIGSLIAADAPGPVTPTPPHPTTGPTPGGVKSTLNIEYAKVGEKSLKLDLYVPLGNPGDAKPPLIMWIHGGAWKAGDKAHMPLKWLTTKGYAIASINYRFSQEAKFPAQIFDCKGALRFLRAHAAEYGFDATRAAVGGDSAGGHLTALMGTSGGVKELEGDVGGNTDQSSKVQLALDYYGPTDFMAFDEHLEKSYSTKPAENPVAQLLGGAIKDNADKARAASPTNYVDAGDPPFLIMQGDKDPLVPVAQAMLLHDALTKAGVENTLKIIEGGGHGGKGFYDGDGGKLALDLLEKHIKAH